MCLLYQGLLWIQIQAPLSSLLWWSGIPISLRIFQFVVIHTVKGFGIVNETEVDVFLEEGSRESKGQPIYCSGLPYCFFLILFLDSYLLCFKHKLLLNLFLKIDGFIFSLVKFSHSVMSDSLQSHGLKHTRLPCPSPTPRPCSNLCPSSIWALLLSITLSVSHDVLCI